MENSSKENVKQAALIPNEAHSRPESRRTIDEMHERLKIAQNYDFSPMIKATIDGNNTQANAWAVTAALFAGILVSIAQTVPSTADAPAAKYEALRFFLVAGIIVNVTGAAFALYGIFSLAQLPNWTSATIVKNPQSLAYRLATGGTIPLGLVGQDESMIAPLHPDPRALLWAGQGILLTGWAGSILTFAAIAIWIWVNYSKAVAGASMIFLVPCFTHLAVVIYYYGVSLFKQIDFEWSERYGNED